MFTKTRKTMMAAAIASAVAVTGIAPALAGGMSYGAPAAGGYNAGDIVLAAERKVMKKKVYQEKTYKKDEKKTFEKKRWSYNSKRHGHRYNKKRQGFSYYHDGYWYAKPFWQHDSGININIRL